MKKFLFLILLFSASHTWSQPVSTTLSSAYQTFLKDPAFKHASISLYVVNTSSGKTVLESNSQLGLAPASTMKIITSAAAYGLLGKDYRYQTSLLYNGTIVNGVLQGDLIIRGSGDPTLGSWRYASTKEDILIADFLAALSKAGIQDITGHVYADEGAWPGEVTPPGWIWQDIGNYYGAGARGLNWRENQYDLLLRSGKELNSPVSIAGTVPSFIADLRLQSALTAGAKGSGDNAYIYLPLTAPTGFVRGTIPVEEKAFKISGAMPNGALQLAITLEAAIKKKPAEEIYQSYPVSNQVSGGTVIYTHSSPGVDSISYWFLNKSINLYGEALVKTIGLEVNQQADTYPGLRALKAYFQKNGIEISALNMQDGSGLSPGNRITTGALVQVLQFTKKQPWFASYYDGFPVINGIRMKSGTISGALGYTGFVKSKNGEEYTFAFIINNYNGGANETRRKMWKLLDVLK